MRRNKKKNRTVAIWLSVMVLLAVLAIKAPGYVRAVFFDEFSDRRDEPVAAIFDRDNAAGTKVLHLPHYTLYWKNTAFFLNRKPELQQLLNNSNTLLTIETWLTGYTGGQSSGNVLEAILKGRFDSNIRQLAQLINQSKHQVYVRFDPDMEVPVNRFPWQYQSPPLYISAYNYVAGKLKAASPSIKMVWAPSGFPGDTEFWPGEGLVDLASVTLGSASEHGSSAYPYQPQLPAFLFSKLHRMRFINKPVLVLGGQALSRQAFNAAWLTQRQAFEHALDTTVYSPENYTDGLAQKPARQQLKVGVFDPNARLLANPNISTEHIFTDWGEIQRGDFKLKFDSIISRRHDAVVTVEPWRDTSKRVDTNALASTLHGRYDRVIQKLYSIISNCGQTVYLRFAHEMEIPIHRYAWQSQDPVQYINAFRYFMRADKIHAPNIKRVWGPAGDRGSADWWPGSDVVDYISIAIYGLPDKNITDPNKQEPFSNIFERKYYRMRFLNKPLFITEFGVKGPEDYQKNWLGGAAKTLRNNKHVFGICYFNLYDNPKAWGHIKAPDWSISPANLQFFFSQVNR